MARQAPFTRTFYYAIVYKIVYARSLTVMERARQYTTRAVLAAGLLVGGIGLKGAADHMTTEQTGSWNFSVTCPENKSGDTPTPSVWSENMVRPTGDTGEIVGQVAVLKCLTEDAGKWTAPEFVEEASSPDRAAHYHPYGAYVQIEASGYDRASTIGAPRYMGVKANSDHTGATIAIGSADSLNIQVTRAEDLR
jgi:hypothetical protein